MSGGGSGNPISKAADLGKKFTPYVNPTGWVGNRASYIAGQAIRKGRGLSSIIEDVSADLASTFMPEPEAPEPEGAPTMEDVAAKEPDKEKRRRQRMAALMAQGRQGTILTGPGGMTPNNSVGGGGKQMVGA